MAYKVPCLYYVSKELNQSNTKIPIRTVVDLLCTTSLLVCIGFY